jgi:hypothetical protein
VVYGCSLALGAVDGVSDHRQVAFNRHMPVVLVLTVVIGFAIAAVSYALISRRAVALRR